MILKNLIFKISYKRNVLYGTKVLFLYLCRDIGILYLNMGQSLKIRDVWNPYNTRLAVKSDRQPMTDHHHIRSIKIFSDSSYYVL
jgi:hypothetical protein